jgi:hypothetical protein
VSQEGAVTICLAHLTPWCALLQMPPGDMAYQQNLYMQVGLSARPWAVLLQQLCVVVQHTL